MASVLSAYKEFGQTLAFTERTLTAVLREHLSEREVEPETWYALKLIAARGPGAARDALSRDLEGSPNLDSDKTQKLLAGLEADGLIAGDSAVDLTVQGRHVFESLRDHVVGATVKLLSQLDLGDIETTVRTLQSVTKLAQQGAPEAA